MIPIALSTAHLEEGPRFANRNESIPAAGGNTGRAGKEILADGTVRMKRVVVLLDTPNLSRSTCNQYGPRARVDFRRLIALAMKQGILVRAIALVNPGAPLGLLTLLKSAGFEPRRANAIDCDDAVVAWTVRLWNYADQVFLGSGDGAFTSVAGLLKEVGIRVSVCAVKSACNPALLRVCHSFVELPVFAPEPPLAGLKDPPRAA